MSTSRFLGSIVAFAAMLFLFAGPAAAVQGAPTPPASLKCKAGKVPTQVTKRSGKTVWRCLKPAAAAPTDAANAAPADATTQPALTPASVSPASTQAEEQARIDAENKRIEDENAQIKAMEEERKRLEEELKTLPGGE